MLSEQEIAKIVDEHTTDDHGYDIWCNGRGVARAIITAYQAKLLAEVEMPEYKYIDRHDVPKEGMCVYTQDQLQSYAAAAAAQARMKALNEAMLAVNSGVLGHGECAAAIESLKGEQE